MDGQMDGEGEYLLAVKHPHHLDMHVDVRVLGQVEEQKCVLHCLGGKKGTRSNTPSIPLPTPPTKTSVLDGWW